MGDRNIHIANPKGGEHVRHIEQTKEDRDRHAKEFREQKNHELELKNERFAAMKKRKKGNSAGGSRGINIDAPGRD